MGMNVQIIEENIFFLKSKNKSKLKKKKKLSVFNGDSNKFILERMIDCQGFLNPFQLLPRAICFFFFVICKVTKKVLFHDKSTFSDYFMFLARRRGELTRKSRFTVSCSNGEEFQTRRVLQNETKTKKRSSAIIFVQMYRAAEFLVQIE